MKTNLNLTIEEHLVIEIKKFAQKNKTNISELVEQYFKKIVPTDKPKNILELVEHLDTPVIDTNTDLKKAYYEEKGKNYGS